MFVYGRVRGEVARITLRYADGDEQHVEPGRYGYVLFVVPPEHRSASRRLVEFAARDAQGRLVSRQPTAR